jgi:hypothetical protein
MCDRSTAKLINQRTLHDYQPTPPLKTDKTKEKQTEHPRKNKEFARAQIRRMWAAHTAHLKKMGVDNPNWDEDKAALIKLRGIVSVEE